MAMTASTMLAVLDQVQNVGQVVEIGQSHVHQKEQARVSNKKRCVNSRKSFLGTRIAPTPVGRSFGSAQVRWARRAYQLESQSVRLDVFDHVKEEIRSHHDTYMGRIDVLLLVLALLLGSHQALRCLKHQKSRL